MRCMCDAVYALTGNDADRYAREHLEELGVDVVNWTVSYKCPDTERRWLRDFPHAELQGGGPPRLRQVDADGHPIEKLSSDPFQ